MATETVLPGDFDAGSLNISIIETSLSTRAAVGNIVDTLQSIDNIDWTYSPRATVKEKLIVCEVISTILHAHTPINESVLFTVTTTSGLVWFNVIQDLLTIESSVSYDPAFYEHLIEELIMSGNATSSLQALVIILESLKLLDSSITAWGKVITETLSMTDIASNNLSAVIAVVESLIIIDSFTSKLSFFSVVNDSFTAIDTASTSQTLFNYIKESIAFGGKFVFDGNNYTVALNTKNKAFSTYDNYNFNSIYGERAAMYDGIYELNSSDDSGIPIETSIKTALMDFGESLHKQIPYVYIGLTNSDKLVLKTITEQNGIKNSRWYEITATKNAEDTTRVQLGRGVKSRYWQFQLTNISGADFHVNSIEILPLILKRRI